MRLQRLMRTWYATDAEPRVGPEAGSDGTFSAPFPAEEETRRIVAVDWSTPGEVMVTWLVTTS